ncbi:hypothetical protein ABEY41_26820 [Peribacillus butanolivorans]|uniref:hypothetical protein n=1 Tax=Peribacillus butanolivorans TaxID=421767 RepID=UPI003D26B6D7
MDKSREQKRRKKNNQGVIKNMNNKKFELRNDNTKPKPDEIEIIDVANNLMKMKGNKKKNYIETTLLNRNDKVEIAQGLVFVFGKLVESSKNISSETIQAHKVTLSRLDRRLNKLNEHDNPYEIKMIYEQIADLSDKIQEVERGYQNILMKLGGLTLIILGGLAGVFINDRNNKGES